MARKQTQNSSASAVVANIVTPVPLSSVELWVTSYEVQALDTNSDFIFIGTSVQQLRSIAAGMSWEVNADNIDNGNTGKINLNEIYMRTLVDGEGCVVSYIEAT